LAVKKLPTIQPINGCTEKVFKSTTLKWMDSENRAPGTMDFASLGAYEQVCLPSTIWKTITF
jgi:hypothetical protein